MCEALGEINKDNKQKTETLYKGLLSHPEEYMKASSLLAEKLRRQDDRVETSPHGQDAGNWLGDVFGLDVHGATTSAAWV